MQDVYITDIAVALPGDPVDNNQIEDVLGKINNIPSTVKDTILKHNGIKTRHYAIDKSTGKLTHSNAELTAEAIKNLQPYHEFTPNDIELLACGSTTPDVIAPGHGLMVHGELGSKPCEVVSTSGICLSGITAFKYGYFSVASGSTENAVTTGSEIASSAMKAGLFSYKAPEKSTDPDIDNNPELLFDSEFLRWMLSDAAGAVYMSNKKNKDSISLKVDWIDHISYASEYDTCMYAGGKKDSSGKMMGYRSDSLGTALYEDYFPLKQDVRILGDNIVHMVVNRHLNDVVNKRKLNPDEIDWYLPHYSSTHFRQPIYDAMKKIGFEIPFERWFTNLPTKGNTGSASIYVMLEELFHSGRLEVGQKLLCFIPESGRFSNAYMMLTVV